MYCPKCGSMVGDRINYCPNCGAYIRMLEQQQTQTDAEQHTPMYNVPPSTNNHAILGFVFSIIGIFTFPLGIFALIGLILSFIGASECNKRAESGMGLAIAGIIIGLLFLVGFVVFWALILFTAS